jgi:hypothetical protein
MPGPGNVGRPRVGLPGCALGAFYAAWAGPDESSAPIGTLGCVGVSGEQESASEPASEPAGPIERMRA